MTKKTNQTDSNLPVTQKAKDKKTVRAVVFDPGSGNRWVEEVEMQEKGTFQLDGRDGMFIVGRGSGWTYQGDTWILVNTQNPQTINVETLVSDLGIGPIVINDIAESNWAEQMVHIARKPPAWKSLASWGVGIAAFLAIGAMFWNVLALGSGLDDLTEAIKSIRIPAGATPIEGSGHSNISPR